jgi:hypothetical protein
MDVSGKSRPEEYGHQEYFDRLRYIPVYAKHVMKTNRIQSCWRSSGGGRFLRPRRAIFTTARTS